MSNEEVKVTKKNIGSVLKELLLFKRPLSDAYKEKAKSFKEFDKQVIARIDKSLKTKSDITKFSTLYAKEMSKISSGIKERENAKVKSLKHEENLIRTIMYTAIGLVVVGVATLLGTISPTNVTLALYLVLGYTAYNVLGNIYQNLKAKKLDIEINSNTKKLEKGFEEIETKAKEKALEKDKEKQATKVNEEERAIILPNQKQKTLVKKL